jgi:hypothetical protein
VYFDFDFQDNKKQRCENLVRSLVFQLSKRSAAAAEVLGVLISQSDDGAKQPSMDIIVTTLKEMLGDFRQVFIILDALEECHQRGELLELLETICDWQLEKIHMLATSRRDTDIVECLELLATGQICLEGEHVDADIRTYISEELRTERNLRKWSADIKVEIQEALMSGADGM